MLLSTLFALRYLDPKIYFLIINSLKSLEYKKLFTFFYKYISIHTFIYIFIYIYIYISFIYSFNIFVFIV